MKTPAPKDTRIDKVVIVPITGRRRTGKDTVAKIAHDSFGCLESAALSAWFKRLLSQHFKLPLEHFYGPEKDKPLAKAIVLRSSDVSQLKSKTSQLSGKAVDIRISKIPTSKFIGLEIKTIRDLMLWWAHEVITLHLGEEFHNQIALEQDLQPIMTKFFKSDKFVKEKNYGVIFVTDARQPGQSSWFQKHFKHVYPIKVTRNDSTKDDSFAERRTDEFPEGYFFEIIANDGSKEQLKEKVKGFLMKMAEDVKTKTETTGTTAKP